MAGILRNISPLPLALAASVDDLDREIILPVLRPVIAATSLTDVSVFTLDLVRRQAKPQMQNLSLDQSLKSDHKSDTEIELERVESNLITLRHALEVLAGVCASLPEPEAETQPEEADVQDDDFDGAHRPALYGTFHS